jgi:hypothetical protein
MNPSPQDRGASRKRSTAATKDAQLQAIRIKTWFRRVLELAVPDEAMSYADIAARLDSFGRGDNLPKLNAALQEWLQQDKQLRLLSFEQAESVQRLGRSRYDEGKTTPTELTLGVFETLLPGSAEVYDLGLGGLPVWRILEGDFKTCEAYVGELLGTHEKPWNKNLSSAIQTAFDQLIAPAYRMEMDSIPVLGSRQQATHPVWLTHINNRYAVTFNESEADQLPEAVTLDDAILLAIALWHLALAQPESPILQLEWLLVGLCWGVIEHHLNLEIQEFLLSDIRNRGVQIDASLRKAGVRLPTFDERWPSGFAP